MECLHSCGTEDIGEESPSLFKGETNSFFNWKEIFYWAFKVESAMNLPVLEGFSFLGHRGQGASGKEDLYLSLEKNSPPFLLERRGNALSLVLQQGIRSFQLWKDLHSCATEGMELPIEERTPSLFKEEVTSFSSEVEGETFASTGEMMLPVLQGSSFLRQGGHSTSFAIWQRKEVAFPFLTNRKYEAFTNGVYSILDHRGHGASYEEGSLFLWRKDGISFWDDQIITFFLLFGSSREALQKACSLQWWKALHLCSARNHLFFLVKVEGYTSPFALAGNMKLPVMEGSSFLCVRGHGASIDGRFSMSIHKGNPLLSEVVL